MIKLKTNYHTHCLLCRHAQGMPHDYIEKAIELGFSEIGISDHGPIIPSWKRMNYEEFINVYLKDINESIEKYSSKIKIYKGLEIEYYEGFDSFGYYKGLLDNLDYLILGQHDLIVDKKIYDIFSNEMKKEHILEYTKEVVSALNTKYFKILAHPDVFMYRYSGKWDNDLINMSREIIEAAIKNDVYLELNVNGARKGLCKTNDGEISWKYPYLEFWRLVSEYKDAKVIINSDCHKISYLYDEVTEEVIKFSKMLKLNVVERIDFFEKK